MTDITGQKKSPDAGTVAHPEPSTMHLKPQLQLMMNNFATLD
ncbi:MAG: hypothetical protein AAGH67_02830 [Cyanobacteria bacterium P01_H01_bin.162]